LRGYTPLFFEKRLEDIENKKKRARKKKGKRAGSPNLDVRLDGPRNSFEGKEHWEDACREVKKSMPEREGSGRFATIMRYFTV